MARDRRPYWVTERLGGCRMPRPGDEERLARLGVTLLVSMVEPEEFYDYWPGGEREFLEAFRDAGIRVLRVPTPDFGAPHPWDACRALEEMRSEIERGGRVVVHCYGGIGRTGTMLAAYLVVVEGYTLEEALEAVRRHGAGPQSEEQLHLLYYLPLQCRPRGQSVL